VIKALRNEREIKRIIYVSCNPTGSLVKDAGLLCGPTTKRYGGLPFKPTSAQPVDMFPLTDHCEMVLVFDRMSHEEYEMSFDDSKQQDGDGKEKKGSLVNEGMEQDTSTDKTICTERKEPSTVEQDANNDKTTCTGMKEPSTVEQDANNEKTCTEMK